MKGNCTGCAVKLQIDTGLLSAELRIEAPMAIWLIRAGSHGEYELKFIQEGRVYVTWDDLDVNLGKLTDRGELTVKG